MLFNKPSNTTTGFLLQTMLYVANITKNDLNKPRTREEFLLTPMGADSGSRNLSFPSFHKINFFAVRHGVKKRILDANCQLTIQLSLKM